MPYTDHFPSFVCCKYLSEYSSATFCPACWDTVLVIATLRIGQLILTEAFLSFLGAGIPPPTATWGGIIADGREYLRDAWWVSVFAGIAIGLTVLALNFFGDWMRDTFDPRLRQV